MRRSMHAGVPCGRRALLLTAVVAASLALAGCRAESPARARAPTPRTTGEPHPALPNIIVILTDTLRADRLGVYGGPRATSPTFDAFAQENVLFERAHSATSWTRPSVASLFTGQYPQRHGVQMRQDVLAAGIPTLAELLQRAGWQTALVNTNPHITDTWGMTRGFGQQVHIMPNPDQFKAGNGANIVLRHLRQLQSKLVPPFLLYVHMIDPHYPYDPPVQDLRALGIDAPQPSELARYDAEIHYVDRHIGRMIETLQSAGHWENSIVVMTSDHGDEFNEHGSSGHGKTLYQEVVHVPLALRIPAPLRARMLGGAGRRQRITENVSLVDLLPTLLDLAGVPPPLQLDGTSLVPRLRGEASDLARPIFFSVEKERSSVAAVMMDRAKLIVDRSRETRNLYLLDENPLEKPIDLSRRPGTPNLKKRLGDLLESYEWTVRPGLHIELAGRDDSDDRRRVRLRLTTDGRFAAIETHSFEGTDKHRLSRDGRTLIVDTRLTSFWHRSPKHVWVQDRDELRLSLEPENSSVTMRLEIDGEPAPTRWLRFPDLRAHRWPTTLHHAQLIAHDHLVDRRKTGVYVYQQSRSESRAVETVSQEINDALRSLGYMQ